MCLSSNGINCDSVPEDESSDCDLSADDDSHRSNHLIQQASTFDTETRHESNDESYLNLNLSNKGINIGFLNVQGLCSRGMTKFSEIELLLTAETNKNIHVFGMCETKLKNHKPTNAFQINGFQLPFRKDNESNGGGGILVYVKDQIMAKRREDLETNNIACLWLEITPKKGKSFLVGTLYKNPSEKVEWNDRFEIFIEHVLTEDKEIVLLGDFNKDLFNFNASREWSVLTESLGLSQLVMEPTRVTQSTSTLLDHIYTNNEDNIFSVRVPKLGISDHYAVFCNRKINQSFKNHAHSSITYRSFKNFNENEFLRDLLSVKWDSLEALENVDDILDKWYSLFTDVINKHAPLKTHRVKNLIQPDWITSDILDTMKERDNHKRQGNIEEYKKLRNKVSELIKSAKKSTYENKIENGKDDPKSVWKIFKEFGASSKSKNNRNNDILGLNINGKIVSDDASIAEHFNDYFINIASNLKEPMQLYNFTKLKNYINSKVPDNIVFDLPNIDQNFVYSFLSTLDTSKATGLDGIGPKLLKLSSGVISTSIAYIVQKCIETCEFPTLWKQAKVTP
ncbi:MAG: endonuclease/exonuclease/phosphatase family protein, partial [Candidatus Thiodiazotropha sp.]